MNSEKVKRENRKHLPKYLLFMLCCAIVGGILGAFAASFSDGFSANAILSALNHFIGAITPWGIIASALLLLGISLFLYRKSKLQFKAWNSQDDDMPLQIETRLSWILLLLSILTVVSFFFFSAAIVYYRSSPILLLVVAEFLLCTMLSTWIQQKCVDLTRCLNPEKQGSIYDIHFQKKWLSSCDEAEQQHIGQAAYRAFRITLNACSILWLLLVVANFFFPSIGLFPSFVVLVIFGILQVSYILASIRQN